MHCFLYRQRQPQQIWSCHLIRLKVSMFHHSHTLTSLSVLLFSLMTLIHSSMSSLSSACSRYSQKSCVVNLSACLRFVSLYAMSTRQPRMLIGCSSSAPPPSAAPLRTASRLSLYRNKEWDRSTENTRLQGQMALPTFCKRERKDISFIKSYSRGRKGG